MPRPYQGGRGTGQPPPSPSASSGGRGRGTLTPEQRLELAVTEAMQRHASLWDIRDVCNWVEYMGFPEYRRKFSHNGWVEALWFHRGDCFMHADHVSHKQS